MNSTDDFKAFNDAIKNGETFDKPEKTLLKTFNYKGYECEIFNNSCFDVKLGYVKIPNKNHKYYGMDMYDIPIKCHGGITLAEVVDDIYIIGFDCGHAWDTDFVEPRPANPNKWQKCNKDVTFVEKELKDIVDQLC